MIKGQQLEYRSSTETTQRHYGENIGITQGNKMDIGRTQGQNKINIWSIQGQYMVYPVNNRDNKVLNQGQWMDTTDLGQQRDNTLTTEEQRI